MSDQVELEKPVEPEYSAELAHAAGYEDGFSIVLDILRHSAQYEWLFGDPKVAEVLKEKRQQIWRLWCNARDRRIQLQVNVDWSRWVRQWIIFKRAYPEHACPDLSRTPYCKCITCAPDYEKESL